MSKKILWLGILVWTLAAGWCWNCGPSAWSFVYAKEGSSPVIKFDVMISGANNLVRVDDFSGVTVFIVLFKDNTSTIRSESEGFKSIGNLNNGEIYLQISRMNLSYAGVFSVIWTLGNGISKCATVYLLGVPAEPTISKAKDPLVGESATLTCSSTSATYPKNHTLSMRYEWKVDGVENPTDSRYSQSGNMYRISNIIKEDSSKQFACRATEDVTEGYTSSWSRQIYLGVIYAPNRLPVIKQGSHYWIVEYTSSELSCSVEGGNPLPTLIWNCYSGNNTNVTSGETVTILLKFMTSQRQDRVCSCVMFHPTGNRAVNISISVLFPATKPTFSLGSFTVSENIQVIQNKTLTVSCTSSGNPEPKLTWRYGSNTRSNPLTIPDIQTSSNGVYICEAENIMNASESSSVTGKSNSSIIVTVLYAPEVFPLDRIDIEEGRQLNQICKFTPGNPSESQVIWSRTKDQKQWKNQLLTIGNITRFDASYYTCTVNNTMKPTGESAVIGEDSKTLILNVWYLSSITLLALNNKTDDVTVKENDTNISFRCDVDSNPGSTITLWHNNKELLTVNNTKTLTYLLPQAGCKNTGQYTCNGYNQYNDQQAAKDISLFVKCSPRPSPFVPLIQHVLSQLYMSPTLQFVALAYPEPDPSKFEWYKEDYRIPIDNSEHFKISTEGLQSNLTIVNVTESSFGNYTLKIGNEIGSWEQAFIVEPYGVPNTPTEFKQLSEKATVSSVTLQWIPGFNGGPQQTFVLEYSKIGTQQWTTVNITHHGETEMTHTIQQLFSGTQYEIVLFAANIIGRSREELTITAVTAVAASTPGVHGAIIGGTVGGGAGFAVFVVVGVFFIKRRRIKKDTDTSRLAANVKETPQTGEDSSDEDVMVENKMYESAGQIMTKDEPVYNKPTKKVKVDTKNTDVYAVVDKTNKKEKQKAKKEKPQKKKQIAQGEIYENAPEKSAHGSNTYGNAAFGDNPYENPEGSKPSKTLKKNINPDGLIYADLAFNDQPKGQKKLVIHGLDEMTTYVQVDFNRKADPLPDSDTDDQAENKKN